MSGRCRQIAGELPDAGSVSLIDGRGDVHGYHLDGSVGPAARYRVRAIRSALGLTQAVFAATFGCPLSTRSSATGEQGRARPEMAARYSLVVFKSRPEAVRGALAAAE